MRTAIGGHDPRALFARAYQDLVNHWPVPVTALDVPTSYGKTHVLICGEQGAPAVILLPGGGATATAWRDVAAGLSRSHRVIAADPIGQPGLSTPAGRPVRTGAWIALRYALHAPGPVSRLVLLDPNRHLRPTEPALPPERHPAASPPQRPAHGQVPGLGNRRAPAGPSLGRRHRRGVGPQARQDRHARRPRPRQLASLHIPALVIVAARSRAHDPRRIASRAQDRLPNVTTATLAHATHHSIPTEDAPELLRHIEPFLARGNY